MKILFRQSENEEIPHSPLGYLGLRQCCLKQIDLRQDDRTITKKLHHHTNYELHLIVSGCQTYAAGQERYTLSDGQFLLVPPRAVHQLLASEPSTRKFAITFSAEGKGASGLPAGGCVTGTVPAAVWEALKRVEEEYPNRSELSMLLAGSRLFEAIVLILREAGMNEPTRREPPGNTDARLALAKQYISDNIELSPSVADAAGYCYLSPKQLNRLFLQYEGISPSQYIREEKIRRIELLLRRNELSLRQISERMHFNNEYYFSAFFKKYSGAAPGAYRKMYIG